MFDFFRIRHNVVPGNQSAAGRGRDDAAKHANGRGLAGAVGAEESEYFALLYREGDFVDRDKCAEFFFQIRHGDGIRVGKCHAPDLHPLL